MKKAGRCEPVGFFLGGRAKAVRPARASAAHPAPRLRRGRRDPQLLRAGDSLDFWRVEEIERDKKLRLYAEMILPGKAWLEFKLEAKDGKTVVSQDALFAPRGLGGQLYWYLVSPFHFFIFPTMLRNIVKSARKSEAAKKSTSHTLS